MIDLHCLIVVTYNLIWSIDHQQLLLSWYLITGARRYGSGLTLNPVISRMHSSTGSSLIFFGQLPKKRSWYTLKKRTKIIRYKLLLFYKEYGKVQIYVTIKYRNQFIMNRLYDKWQKLLCIDITIWITYFINIFI